MFSNLSFGRTMLVTATGIIIVFLVLFLLIIIISIFGKVFGNKKSKKAQEQETTTQQPLPAQKANNDAELIAVISAAVYEYLGNNQQYVIKTIRDKNGRPLWSRAGIRDNTRSFR